MIGENGGVISAYVPMAKEQFVCVVMGNYTNVRDILYQEKRYKANK